MKAFLMAVVMLGLAAAALFVPVGGRTMWARARQRGIPAAVARSAAHGLRAGWDYLASLGNRQAASGSQATREPPAHSPRHPSRKAQAAAAQTSIHRASREGIVAQPPKERLERTDRAALDALVKSK